MLMLTQANALRIPLADKSVHMICTSPPYWSLRDYGIDGQLGLEKTPEEYVAKMVEVFMEVRRVLRDDGTVWLNLGDRYASQGGHSSAGKTARVGNTIAGHALLGREIVPPGFKPKDLCGIPWRVALALQADGWWLRDAVVWAKAEVNTSTVPMFDMPVENVLEGSSMPGSQDDRCTSSYEFIFQLAKSRTYYFDQEAEKTTSGAVLRNVWRMTPQSYKGAHSATFCEELPRRCIKLGTSERGVCPKCGAGWTRVVSKGFTDHNGKTETAYQKGSSANRLALLRQAARESGNEYANTSITTDWRATCTCDAGDPVPAIVLDPFVGSGTTLQAARQLGRHGIGLDLSYTYLHDQARHRLELATLDEWTNGKPAAGSLDDLPLFALERTG